MTIVPSDAPACQQAAPGAADVWRGSRRRRARHDGRRAGGPLFNDVHFHLTNYVQKGPTAQQFLRMVGPRVGRIAMFGILLQQEWSHDVSGDFAPTYYLQSDAPLYYYSFTDAHIALAYRSLSKTDQSRIDPMIAGFNPADMYAADHIRRVLEDFPDVFSGIGEFSIHKEFVSGKIAGGTPSLLNPALDRILDFAGEVGLVVLIHNDIDVPFAKADERPTYLADLEAVFKRHPRTTIIWAHRHHQPAPRPFPVRHRRGRPDDRQAVLQPLRAVRPALDGADGAGSRQDAQGQLHPPVRSRPQSRPGWERARSRTADAPIP